MFLLAQHIGEFSMSQVSLQLGRSIWHALLLVLKPTQRMPILCATTLSCLLCLRDPSRRSQTSSSWFSY